MVFNSELETCFEESGELTQNNFLALYLLTSREPSKRTAVTSSSHFLKEFPPPTTKGDVSYFTTALRLSRASHNGALGATPPQLAHGSVVGGDRSIFPRNCKGGYIHLSPLPSPTTIGWRSEHKCDATLFHHL